jgi:uncharacterized protein (DUF1800 family)
MLTWRSVRGPAVTFVVAAGFACGTATPRQVAAPARLAPATSPVVVDEVHELTADQAVNQVLDRMAFGPRPGDARAVRAMGVGNWINQQLHPEEIDDRIGDSVVALFPTMTRRTAELADIYALPQELRTEQQSAASRARPASGRAYVAMPDSMDALRTRADSVALHDAQVAYNAIGPALRDARVARAVLTRRQLLEVMTDFWENHFSIWSGKGADYYLLVDFDRAVIRPHALGKFRDLLGAVAKSPAMLYYLDNWDSGAEPTRPLLVGNARRKGHGLNENYGRELLELHTLGVDGGYTQQDVIDVARALTGWTIADPNHVGTFVFRPEWHDAGVTHVLGHTLAAGRGMQDGEDVLDIVARHPATARYIARKLCVRFVSDSPPPALVDRAAATFTRTGGDIREVMRTIVTSKEFFSREAYRTKVKSPFELVVSALRAVNAGADTTQRSANAVAQLGEPLFGHVAPNGYPETGEAWINAGAILSRINYGMAVVAGSYPGVSIATLPYSMQPDSVVGAVLQGEVSVDTRRILTSGVNPLVSGGGQLPARAGGSFGGTKTVGLALGAPEFQRH